MKIIIDRFEGEYAVCELPDGSFVQIPAAVLPGAHEGDVAEIRICGEDTKRRRDVIEEKARRMFED